MALKIQHKPSGTTPEEMAVTRDEREQKAGRSFDESVALFVKLVTALVETHYQPRKSSDAHWDIKVWAQDAGKRARYVRIWKQAEIRSSFRTDGTKYIYAFLDKETGDVLMPATCKAPAKHARGNVFDENPVAQCNHHGPAYLK